MNREVLVGLIRKLEDRELYVLLCDYPHDVTAKLELSHRAEIVAQSFDHDDLTAAFVEAVAELRHGIALTGMVGKMVLSYEQTRDGQEEAARQAIDLITEEELTISLEDVASALGKEAEASQRMVEGIEKMIDFVEAQQSDQGENITLHEAVRRQEEGTKRLQRIARPGAQEEQ